LADLKIDRGISDDPMGPGEIGFEKYIIINYERALDSFDFD